MAWLVLLTLSMFPLTGNAGNAISDCGSDLIKDQVCVGKISELHPMQSSVGFHEVNKKAKKLSSMTPEEFTAYLEKNPVPVIVGPGRFIAPVDHHHLASSILNSGHDSAVFQVLENWEAMTMDEFWQAMNDAHYVYLKDNLGNPITPAELPISIATMSDDPYRSLSGAVEDEAGFNKASTAYFIEFSWALFFRNLIAEDLIQNDFKKAVKKAVKIAHSDAAKDQPGFIPLADTVTVGDEDSLKSL